MFLLLFAYFYVNCIKDSKRFARHIRQAMEDMRELMSEQLNTTISDKNEKKLSTVT